MRKYLTMSIELASTEEGDRHMAFRDARARRGLYRAEVRLVRQLSPHIVRITFGGEDLRALPREGFDHWVRLFLPTAGASTDFDSLPESFGVAGYLKYLTQRSGVRPVVRSYTIRAQRDDEVDIDFVSHGTQGVAGPWAREAQPGEQVAMIDQGRGFEPRPESTTILLVGDESAMPAVLGILRDLPPDTVGSALIEIPEPADAQPVVKPSGVELRWVQRASADETSGRAVLRELGQWRASDAASVAAYIAGEQALASGARRYLVDMGVDKADIDFTGYWRAGKAAG